MDILIITRDIKDGIGTTVKNLVWEYEKREDIKRVVVVAPGEFEIHSNKVEFWIAPMKGNLFFIKEPTFALSVKKLLKEKLPNNSFDAIHLHSNILGYKYIKKYLGNKRVISTFQGTHKALITSVNVPIISTFHNTHIATLKSVKISNLKYVFGKYLHIPFAYLDKLRIRESKIVTCVSKITLEEIKKDLKDEKKDLRYLPNGTNALVYKPKEVNAVKFFAENYNIDVVGKKLVLYMGRLESGKGIFDLAEAVKDMSDVLLIMAGMGPEDEKLKEYKNVRLLGYVADPNIKNNLLNAVDLFVISSLYENFPLVVVEAMATKKAIVSTKVGMIPEILEYREESLVNVGDIKELNKKIKVMLENKELNKLNGEKNLAYVNKYLKWETISGEYINLYNLLK